MLGRGGWIPHCVYVCVFWGLRGRALVAFMGVWKFGSSLFMVLRGFCKWVDE